jgi:hypothetical protein
MNVSSLKIVFVPAFAIIALALGFLQNSAAASSQEYAFKVQNSTGSAIKQVLVSEDGKTWSKFNIGSGIAAGATVKLVWDSSTNNEACKQWVKAVFSDGRDPSPRRSTSATAISSSNSASSPRGLPRRLSGRI